MMPDIYYIQPYSLSLHYGQELNKHIQCFPDNAWIVVTDADTLFLTPNHGRVIHNAIMNYPDTELFTCQVNRLGQHTRCYNNTISRNDSILHHIRIASRLEHEETACEETTGHLAGFFWCFPKRVWLKNKFDDKPIIAKSNNKIESFDVRWTNNIKGKKMIIKGLYVWHTYRLGSTLSDTTHLNVENL